MYTLARKRPLPFVANSDEKKKTALLEGIKAFLDPQTRAWYSRRGIPYRKGYLLYGPPGTGKSSLSLSIAGACDLDIYILNISSVDDSSLGELFTELPAHCVILLEDIDDVDATQSRQRGTGKTGQDETSSSTKGKSQGHKSFNRPAEANIDQRSWTRYGRRQKWSTRAIERINAQSIVTLRKLMTEFANKIPEQEFSPAEIQSFLLEYRRSPHMAVENVQEWVVRTREGKGK
ncbi:hypothetical protein B0J14DRAFT_629552 [Halenospora varia]|nr:hypothetical protein B0J14DRAFT_629552 [Halenospora varia]